MNKRVVIALATVWLASIVEASVPPEGTTGVSTPNRSGATPDQYILLLQSLRNNAQDDYGKDYDESSRMKVENRREKLGPQQTGSTNMDKSLLLVVTSHESADRKVGIDTNAGTPYHPESSDVTKESQLYRKAVRMSSMKVAFDTPIDSELYDQSRKEYWTSRYFGDRNVIQQDDKFVADDTSKDVSPGSNEVYQLDLYKDRSILGPKPSDEEKWRYGNKIPKEVLAANQLTWKAKDPSTRKRVPRITSEFDYRPDRFLVSSRSFKERVFGVQGVSELQAGCEGVKGFRRQKRSVTQTPDQNISGAQPDMSSRNTKVYIEPDYDSEEELDEVTGEDELKKILRQAASMTDSTSSHKNRGDMDPRMEPNRPRKEDKLPTRGDLGPSGEPDSSYHDQVPQEF